LLNVGFNRISIGVQSFHDVDLQEMGRRHNASQSIEAIHAAYKGGFRNIGMDLIYGLPWSNIGQFNESLDIFKTLPVNHLSAYHLTFEEGTPFHRLLQRGVYSEINDNDSFRQYEGLCRFTAELGYEHYEVSNFSKVGFRSKHNSSYWNGSPYIGFGPGSHSYYDGKRRWNKSDLVTYNKADWSQVSEEELLDKKDIFNEALMLGLRTVDGVDLAYLESIDPVFFNAFLKKIPFWINKGDLSRFETKLICSEKSWFIVDSIIKDLFI
jgi:oxygen-independent coproporphyrinogen-3 oxidase